MPCSRRTCGSWSTSSRTARRSRSLHATEAISFNNYSRVKKSSPTRNRPSRLSATQRRTTCPQRLLIIALARLQSGSRQRFSGLRKAFFAHPITAKILVPVTSALHRCLAVRHQPCCSITPGSCLLGGALWQRVVLRQVSCSHAEPQERRPEDLALASSTKRHTEGIHFSGL